MKHLLAAVLIACTLTACDALPEALGPAQNAVVEAQRAVDELEADGTATPEQVAAARARLETASEALDKISNDPSPEAGALEVLGGILASTTGQPWFYIAGAGIAGYLRQRAKTKIAESNGVALAKSVQPAIDAVDETVKTRIRDLQKGQPGLKAIVVAARSTD